MSVREVLLGDLVFAVQHSLNLVAGQRWSEIGELRQER